MNNIGFGIFCFGENYYYKGAVKKIKEILNNNYHCYILTEDTEYFKKIFSNLYVHTIEYQRINKSYCDKILLPKTILKNHDLAILLDADLHISNYDFLNFFKNYVFKKGITYIDTLLNHRANKEYVKDLFDPNNYEWKYYYDYAKKIYPEFTDFVTIWEYFLVFNKDGFNQNEFYNYYEKLQITKEFCDIPFNKDIIGAGEGISLNISAKLSKTQINRDMELYEILKNNFISISRKYTDKQFWPDWMKDDN